MLLVLVRNLSLFWTILFSPFDRPLTLISVFNIVYFTLNILAAADQRHYVSFNAVRVIDQAFDEIDTNGNGIISYAEFSNYVKKHGVSSKDVKNMFDVADSSYGDDDGQISRQEFRNVMNAAGGAGVSPAWNKLYKTYAASVGTKRGTGGRGGGGARPAKRARPRR